MTGRWEEWLELFPTLDALAAAPLEAVLRAWQGLGYNRRAVALAPGASGNSVASMLLGFGSSGTQTAFSFPWESLHYQGYYGQDTWQATNKLTVTMGMRWEIPGVWTERYNHNASFDPHEVNPAVKAAGITLNGQPIMGAVDFANTAQMPQKGTLQTNLSPAGHCLPPGQ